MVPAAAVQRSPKGNFVYVVKADNTVELRPVEVLLTEGDTIALKGGVAAGREGGDRRPGQAAARAQGGSHRRPSPSRRSSRSVPLNPSRPFILRPIATSLLMAGLMLVGLLAFKELPVSALPQVDYPTIQVLTFYPGASPDVMATAVTAPLERQFGQLPGLNQMTSSSSDGSSIITLQFVLDLNIDVAEQQVQAAVNAAGTYLPGRPAQSAHLQQDQPGRRAHPDPGPDLGHPAPAQGGGLRRHPAGPEDLPAARAWAW